MCYFANNYVISSYYRHLWVPFIGPFVKQRVRIPWFLMNNKPDQLRWWLLFINQFSCLAQGGAGALPLPPWIPQVTSRCLHRRWSWGPDAFHPKGFSPKDAFRHPWNLWFHYIINHLLATSIRALANYS